MNLRRWMGNGPKAYDVVEKDQATRRWKEMKSENVTGNEGVIWVFTTESDCE